MRHDIMEIAGGKGFLKVREIKDEEFFIWGDMKMKKALLAYFNDEEGQTTLEYALIVIVVVAILVQLQEKMTDGVGGLIDGVFNQIQEKFRLN